MGQYHHLVNLDKREYLNPHDMGLGLKQWEQVSDNMALAMIALLACSNGRGGGDLPVVEGVSGRWTGDRIAMVGDYSEDGDIPGYEGAELLYGLCGADEDDVDEVDGDGNRYYPEGTKPFTDITPLICSYIEQAEGGMFVGSGWRQFIKKGRVCMWSPEPGSHKKMHGTVERIDHETGEFWVLWDGRQRERYTRDKAPYLMPSNEPGPRMAPDMIVMAGGGDA